MIMESLGMNVWENESNSRNERKIDNEEKYFFKHCVLLQ